MKLALPCLALLLPLPLLASTRPLAGPRPDPGPSQETRPEPAIRLEPRTVILVRHAEKSTEGDPRDPELSEEGEQRAKHLARLLSYAGVTRVIGTEFQRTQATLRPLAQRFELQVEVRPAGEIDALVSELASAEPGSVTVVCGHSNTIPAIAARLGIGLANVEEGPQGPVLDEAEYDRVFLLHLPPSTSAVRPVALELRYGR